jgi:RNA polymerase sigma-70 factor (ECF subfamily)
MADSDATTEQVEQWITLLQQGDRGARDALLACAGDRLLKLTRKMLRLSADVRRWEQTDDVFQNAMMRLYRSLEQVELQDARHFFHVAALQIRRELIDLARRYQGPHGMGRNLRLQPAQKDQSETYSPGWEPAEQTYDPADLATWLEFHQRVELLPEEERDVFQLLWYGGLSTEETAEALRVSARTVRRRWQAARLALHDVLARNTIEL